eukprot:m.292999 g.292999  ORF g.292999 m.292999 type:complete len:313 (+) comp40735_c0_seq11:897-1835(+)
MEDTNPESKFHFRPYRKAEPSAKQLRVSESDSDSEQLEEDERIAPPDQSLLYVHQELWQQDGNTITLMDATYKTTKYDLALFFVCVKTNVNYMVVADFVVQSEAAENIQEALEVLKAWNPSWMPPTFMSDYSDAQITALKSVFPDVRVYLCDFHREQAWVRWVRDRKHGLNAIQGEELLTMLRNLAQALHVVTPYTTLTTTTKKRKNKLQKSQLWLKTEVQRWLTNKWLPVPQMWARCHRDDDYHAAVETDNGTEAQKRLLKYSYLPRRRDLTLSSICELIVNSFLPDQKGKVPAQKLQSHQSLQVLRAICT